jgi:predicted Zn-dependent peptidase
MRARALVLAVLASAAPAQAAPSAQSWPLDEATTVVLVEDHRAPVASIEIEFPAGTWSRWFRENHAEEGFEIQAHDPEGRLRSRADRLGVTLSLSAGRRSAILSASALKEDFEGALGLVRDVLANSEFDRRELFRRRQQRRIAWKGSQKEPEFRGRQAIARLLFAPGDPRRLAVEKPEPLLTDPARLAAARDVLVRLPGRVIAFAGDLTRDEAEKAALGLLPEAGPPPPGLDPDLLPIPTTDVGKKDVTVRLPRLTQVYFGSARESLPYGDPDYPAFLVADHVLGGHFYSRLLSALRHEGGETYGASTLNLGDTAPGPYALGTFTRTENADVAERKLRDVLRVFHESGITEEERAAAVGFLKGNRLFERQSPRDVLDRYLRERRLGLPPGFLDDAAERASRLALEEINRFVSRYYAPASFGMVRVAPER